MFQDAVAILMNNSGQHSGGILVANTTEVTFKSSFKVNFTGNSGESNGAISLYSKSRLTFTGSLSTDDYCFFYKNNGSTFLSLDSKVNFTALNIKFIFNDAYISENHFISGTAIFANSSALFQDCQVFHRPH